MKIVIIAHFTRDFSETDNGRFLYLAKMLAMQNHQVELITNDFNHGRKEHRGPLSVTYPFKVTMLREPGYRKNVSIIRFYSHHVWGKHLNEYLKTIEKPDVVYCAVPSLTGPSYAADYCHKNQIRFVIDIQDLWPEAFQMVLKVPGLLIPFQKKADRIYSKADSICAVSQTYVDRALKINKKCTTGQTVFLGTSVAAFDEYANDRPIMRKPCGELWLAYCGSLGKSYDLKCVIDSLCILKEKGIHMKLIVMGSGTLQSELEDMVRQKKVDAVFTGRLPYNQMCSLLCQCDITVNPISHMASGSIINKHGDYACSGLPVVSTQESKEYRELVEHYQMGFNCKNNDAGDLADKLQQLIADPGLRAKMGKNARKCAIEMFDREHTYQKLVNEITNLSVS